MKFFVHNQTVAQKTWVILHNMDSYPVGDVIFESVGRKKLMPDSVTLNDLNTITVTFSVERTGTATLAAGGTSSLIFTQDTTR